MSEMIGGKMMANNWSGVAGEALQLVAGQPTQPPKSPERRGLGAARFLGQSRAKVITDYLYSGKEAASLWKQHFFFGYEPEHVQANHCEMFSRRNNSHDLT